jgi:hypothetical protein
MIPPPYRRSAGLVLFFLCRLSSERLGSGPDADFFDPPTWTLERARPIDG